MRPDRYGGVERLVWNMALGLIDYVAVDVLAPSGSRLPGWKSTAPIRVVDSGPAIYDFREPNLLGACYLYRLDGLTPDVVLDFSHSRPAQHFPDWKTITPIWHDPYVMSPALPRQNIAALSRWQRDRHYTRTGVRAQVLDPITASVPAMNWELPAEESGRYLCVGKMHETKGAVIAAAICREVGVELDIVGAQTKGDPPEYVEAVRKLCDGKQVVYHGELPDGALQKMTMQAKALLYPVNYPLGKGESHSHKMVDVMALGTPCIAFDQGAMREVVTNGVTGQVVSGYEEMAETIEDFESGQHGRYDRRIVRDTAMARWDIPQVASHWIGAIEDVAKGITWN